MGFQSRGTVAVMLLFLLMGGGTVVSQPAATNPPAASITVLFDLSYSMGLPLSLNKDDTRGATRLSQAKSLMRSLLATGGGRTHWSLLTFGGRRRPGGGGSAVRVRRPFTTDKALVGREVASLSTWGTTALAPAILAAERYTLEAAPTRRRILLVISDGIATTPVLYELPAPHRLRRSGLPILFAGTRLTSASDVERALSRWAARAGGLYVDAGSPVAVRSALRSLENRDVAPKRDVPIAAPSPASSLAVPSSVAPGTRWLPPRLRFLLRPPVLYLLALLVIILPLVVLVVRRIRWRRRRTRQREERVGRFVRQARGRSESFDTAGGSIRIRSPGAGEAAGMPVVTIEGERAYLSARRGPILVNGVATRQGALEPGDRIRIPGSTWVYQGTELVSAKSGEKAPSAFRHIVFASLLAVACAISLVGLFPQDVIPPAARLLTAVIRLLPGPFAPAPSARPSPRSNAVPRPTGGIGASGPSSPPGAQTLRAKGPGAPLAAAAREPVPGVARMGALLGGTRQAGNLLRTQVVAPDEQPPFFKADIMFIHAHPDDATINFGGLMAIAARSGKRIVTVLFTDGNAGLDRYPDRRVGGRYPPRPLHGSSLAAVRVADTASALSLLGSRAYVRLGLRNNPYDSVTQILPRRVVLERWGGDGRVVGKLVRLLEGYRPTIVVSPDTRHYGVFTHFEHEAVGYVTDQALERLVSKRKDFVRAHLVSVDPLLRSRYPGAFGVDVARLDPVSGLTYRAIQVEALRRHRTQRDAAVIAAEVVPNFDDEYYAAVSWHFPISPSRYFSRLGRAVGGEYSRRAGAGH